MPPKTLSGKELSMPQRYTTSVQMRGSAKATPSVSILANSPEAAYRIMASIIGTVWDEACRPDAVEFSVSVCDSDLEITHFRSFEE